eukprot:1185050-Prorocentrum_minimum.AAC.1
MAPTSPSLVTGAMSDRPSVSAVPHPYFAYSLSPSAIGARYGYILSPLLRLVPATASSWSASSRLCGRIQGPDWHG